MRLALGLLLLGGTGCAILHPAGWRDDAALHWETRALPVRPFSADPSRWQLPGGEVATLTFERNEGFSGFGLYHRIVHFDLVTEHEKLRCETEPRGENVPETRFGCWLGDDREHAPVALWIAPGLGCGGRHLAYLDTVVTPHCWEGQGVIDGRVVVMHHGSVKSTMTPYGQLTWRFADEQDVLMAVDVTHPSEVHSGEPSGHLPPELRRRLLLLSLAIGTWESALDVD